MHISWNEVVSSLISGVLSTLPFHTGHKMHIFSDAPIGQCCDQSNSVHFLLNELNFGIIEDSGATH